MKLKALLTVTALVELGSGIALLIAPSLSAQLLVSAPLDSAQLAVIGRFAGAALTAIGVICWVESRIERADSRAGLLLGLDLQRRGARDPRAGDGGGRHQGPGALAGGRPAPDPWILVHCLPSGVPRSMSVGQLRGL